MPVTIEEQGAVTIVKAMLTTNSSGDASELTSEQVQGAVIRVVTVPDALVPPDAGWDLTVTDRLGIDLLAGAGANRDSGGSGATEDFIISDSRVFSGRLAFTVAAGGASKRCTVFAFLGEGVSSPSPSSTDVDAALTNSSSLMTALDLVGLTAFSQAVAGATNASGNSWVDLLDESTITNPVRICGFTVTENSSWVGASKVRITTGAGAKIWPFKDEYVEGSDFINTSQVDFAFSVDVPVASGYKFQFRSSNTSDLDSGAALTLDNLDIITVT